jgi:hypothetical protein
MAGYRPLLEPLADHEALLARLTAALGLPVLIRSYGPTAGDKRIDIPAGGV